MAINVERIRLLIDDETVELPTISVAQAEETVRLFRVTVGISWLPKPKGHG